MKNGLALLKGVALWVHVSPGISQEVLGIDSLINDCVV